MARQLVDLGDIFLTTRGVAYRLLRRPVPVVFLQRIRLYRFSRRRALSAGPCVLSWVRAPLNFTSSRVAASPSLFFPSDACGGAFYMAGVMYDIRILCQRKQALHRCQHCSTSAAFSSMCFISCEQYLLGPYDESKCTTQQVFTVGHPPSSRKLTQFVYFR